MEKSEPRIYFFLNAKLRYQERGKLHRRLHWEINAEFLLKPWVRKPAGDSSSKGNVLLHHPVQQSVWVVCVLCVGFLCLCGFFFSEPETKIVETTILMLFY